MRAHLFGCLFFTLLPISTTQAAVKIDCTPTGQECPADMACWPMPEGTYECFPSDGRPLGSSCDPDSSTWETLPCEDGTACMQIGDYLSDGQCLAFCSVEAPCEGMVECVIPVFEGMDDLGICPPPCTDVDGDGACADVDCDDQDVTSFPGAEEICDDGRDNDCDGDIDALDDACGEDDPDAGVDGGPDADLDADTDAGTDATTDVPGTNPQKKKDTFACRTTGGLSTDSRPAAGGLLFLALLFPALRRRRTLRS